MNGANYGLDEQQILRRDKLIEEIRAGLQNFTEAYGLELPYTFGAPSPGGRNYDESWVNKSWGYTRNLLIGYLAKLILGEVERNRLDGELFKGSSYSVALKLCTSYPFKKRRGLADENSDFRLVCETRGLGLTFEHIVERVSEEYERNYKLYRLWDDRALDLLAQYLFYGQRDCTIFTGGALWEELHSQGEPVCLNDFIEAVDQALINLPMENLTEHSFPDYTGVLFTDYVPAENMSPTQKEELYRRYVDVLSI